MAAHSELLFRLCANEIETPTLETSELLVAAELSVVSHVADQLHECCLQEVTVVDWRDPIEGAEP